MDEHALKHCCDRPLSVVRLIDYEEQSKRKRARQGNHWLKAIGLKSGAEG